MSEGKTEASIYQQAEDGKTELSLMHFAITNPQWQPPRETTHFISQLKERVHREATGAPSDTHPMSLSESEVGWWTTMHTQVWKWWLINVITFSLVKIDFLCCLFFLFQPRSLIANLLTGPSTLASVHFDRDISLANHAAAGINDGGSALRSLSPISSSLHLRGSLSAAHRAAGHTSRTMAGSG